MAVGGRGALANAPARAVDIGAFLAAALGPRAWLALELPAGRASGTAAHARALDDLAAALRDRDVSPVGAGHEHVFVDADGTARLVAVPDLALGSAGVDAWRAALVGAEVAR